MHTVLARSQNDREEKQPIRMLNLETLYIHMQLVYYLFIPIGNDVYVCASNGSLVVAFDLYIYIAFRYDCCVIFFRFFSSYFPVYLFVCSRDLKLNKKNTTYNCIIASIVRLIEFLLSRQT